jgi:hypothetical protein
MNPHEDGGPYSRFVRRVLRTPRRAQSVEKETAPPLHKLPTDPPDCPECGSRGTVSCRRAVHPGTSYVGKYTCWSHRCRHTWIALRAWPDDQSQPDESQ